MAEAIAFHTIYLEKNLGHGNARRRSLSECSYSFVALMDADDISLHHRFEKQLRRFLCKENLSIVGGQISEFSGRSKNITGIRVVPEKHEAIASYMKKRCPMNQVSVMFKKEDVERAGGYQDWYCEEDYYLWIRMMEVGCKFDNIPDILVNVRAGEKMSSRRGGWKYFISEAKLQRYMLKNGIISLPRFLFNIGIRFGGEVLVSNRMRQKLFSVMRLDPYIYYTESEIVHNEKTKIEEKEKNIFPPFSVSMCVYGGDNAEWFDTALESVINQTVKPSEIVLVVDGPISQEIQDVISKYEKICDAGMANPNIC